MRRPAATALYNDNSIESGFMGSDDSYNAREVFYCNMYCLILFFVNNNKTI